MIDARPRVVLLDDDTERARAWAHEIQGRFNCIATPLTIVDVRAVINALFMRRKRGRNGENWRTVRCEILDGTDLIIVDHDLQNVEDEGEWTTGTELAEAMRIVSETPYIVVVNKDGTNRFDLTMLKAADSPADLDIGSEQVLNHGLWQSTGFRGYRPWAWPNLIGEPACVHVCRTFVRANLDTPILASLGFSEDADTRRSLRPEIWGRLCPVWSSTFRELVVPTLGEPIHLLEKDLPVLSKDDEQIANLAASLVRRWLEKVVLPNQDVLADVPHLAVRIPWALTNWREEAAWHAIETLSEPVGIDKTVHNYRFLLDSFCSRPVYWADALEETLQKPDAFDYAELPDLVFREDVSQFGPRTESIDFSSQVLSIANRRWVSDPDKMPVFDGPNDLRKVNFEPQSLLLD